MVFFSIVLGSGMQVATGIPRAGRVFGPPVVFLHGALAFSVISVAG
jgi:hypothetical protein